MSILDRIRVARRASQLKRTFEEDEKRKAERAREKLVWAEEKGEAQKYIRRAKKQGIELKEDEAIALARIEKKKKQSEERKKNIKKKISKFAEGFESIGEEIQPRKGRKGKKKGKKKGRSSGMTRRFDDIISDDFDDWDALIGGKGRGGFFDW